MRFAESMLALGEDRGVRRRAIEAVTLLRP